MKQYTKKYCPLQTNIINFQVDSKASWCYYKDIIKKELNMGMSGYIMDIEDKFWDKVLDKVKESEHISEAMDFAVTLGKTEVPFMDTEVIEDGVSEAWDEIWSKYYV